MKKILIVDITTLTKNDRVYGHFLSLIKNYLDIFEEVFQIYVCGGSTYCKELDKNIVFELPFFINFDSNKNIFQKFSNKFKEFVNCLKSLNVKSDIYIYQCYSTLPLLLGILLGNSKNKKIFIIEYKINNLNFINKFLFNNLKKRIVGLICPSAEVGKSYGINYLVVPDYLYKNNSILNNSLNKSIDILSIGTMSNSKDIEMLIDTFKNDDYLLKIIGNFEDKDRYKKLINNKSENISIIDKYLTNEEYEYNLSTAKYIILPYKKVYDDISSGVVLDALYRKIPVIAPDLKSFQFIKKWGLGYIYIDSINEVKNKLNDEKQYINIQKNIDNYLKYLSSKNKELEIFLKS